MAVDPLDTLEVPLATLAMPVPTVLDRFKVRAISYGGFLVGGCASAFILHLISPLLIPRAAFSATLTQSVDFGAIGGGVLFGVAIASIAKRSYLAWRFRDRQERTLFERSVYRRNHRATIEKIQRSAELYPGLSWRGLLVLWAVLMVVGSYVWLAWAGMFVGVDAQMMTWRGFSLRSHHRPMTDVVAIFRTAKPLQRSLTKGRPCVVVQFNDRTEYRSDEISTSDADCERFAHELSNVSGVAIQRVPWLPSVPAPR